MTFEVRLSRQAEADLIRLHGHLLSRAETADDLALADRAVDEIEVSCKAQLARTPHIFRRAEPSATRRELVIPFVGTGYVALFEMSAGSMVTVLAVRHQREDDYR